MENLIAALQQAGFTVVDTVQHGERVELTLTRDGAFSRFGTPLDISAYGVEEAVRWLDYRWSHANREE